MRSQMRSQMKSQMNRVSFRLPVNGGPDEANSIN